MKLEALHPVDLLTRLISFNQGIYISFAGCQGLPFDLAALEVQAYVTSFEDFAHFCREGEVATFKGTP
jgi:hypothetical protein